MVTIKIKRMTAPVVELIEEEEELEAVAESVEATAVEEDAEEEEVSPYATLSIAEMRSELGNRGLDTTGKKSDLIGRLIESDDAEEARIAAEKAAKKAKPAIKPAPVVKAAKPAPIVPAPKPVAKVVKPAPAPVVEEDAEEDEAELAPAPKPGKVGIQAPTAAKPNGVYFTLKEMLEGLGTGQTVSITRMDEANWHMALIQPGVKAVVGTVAPAKPASAKLRGDAFWKEVLTPEYYEWMYVDCGTGKPWHEMESEEKVSFAEENGIVYAEAEDNRVTMLNLVSAVLKAAGTEKYKAEYKSSKARDALRG